MSAGILYWTWFQYHRVHHFFPFDDADCIIRIMDYAESKGLRIAAAVVAKAAYNETRPHLHGGKAF